MTPIRLARSCSRSPAGGQAGRPGRLATGRGAPCVPNPAPATANERLRVLASVGGRDLIAAGEGLRRLRAAQRSGTAQRPHERARRGASERGEEAMTDIHKGGSDPRSVHRSSPGVGRRGDLD
jgi:hypothetical protein